MSAESLNSSNTTDLTRSPGLPHESLHVFRTELLFPARDVEMSFLPRSDTTLTPRIQCRHRGDLRTSGLERSATGADSRICVNVHLIFPKLWNRSFAIGLGSRGEHVRICTYHVTGIGAWLCGVGFTRLRILRVRLERSRLQRVWHLTRARCTSNLEL